MKRVMGVVVLVAVFLIPSFASATSFGVKAGLVFADQSLSYTDFENDLDTRNGFQLGVFAEFPIIKNFTFTPELQYIQKGGKATYMETTEEFPEGTGRFISVKPRLDYISIPLMLRAKYQMQTIRPFITIGPRFDIEIGQDADVLKLLYDEFDTFVMGFNVGGGVELPITSKNYLMIELMYGADLTKVYESDLVEVKNSSISLLAGLTF